MNAIGLGSATAAKRSWRGAVAAAALLAATTPVIAAGQTAAGTPIPSTATLRADGVAATASNTVTMIVAERLDCTLAQEQADAGMVAIRLTNTGNGQEAFVVTGVSSREGAPRSVAADMDGDGRFDPAHDHWLSDGLTSTLPPGATLRLFVPVDGDASGLAVVAAAITGSGAAGTPFAGKGDGGSDAVTGATSAAARLAINVAAATPPTLTQTQAVLAPDGGTTPRRGSLVTYTLVARFAAATPAARLVDPVPAGTTYHPASLMLDGVVIADAGHLADGRITVALGAVAAGAVHRLSFTVTVQ